MMTNRLAEATRALGPGELAFVIEYLRRPLDDPWLTLFRRTAADILDEGAPADPGQVDERLVSLAATWAASVPSIALSPVGAWIRVAAASRDLAERGAPALLFDAVAAEVDEALGLSYLLPNVA